MKLVTWNVNSIRARAEFVSLFLDEVAPDVLCIQELKTTSDNVPTDIFESRGYHLAIHGQPQWNGVLIASRSPLEDVVTGVVDVEEDNSRMIAATTMGLRLVNLYCPQGQSVDADQFAYKLRFFRHLREWIAENVDLDSDNFVLTGDLNIAPRPEDLYEPARFAGTPSHHPLELEEWAKLEAMGLHDAVVGHIAPKTWSFWDYRGGAFRYNKGMRIDHFLVNAPVLARVSSAGVIRDWRKKKQGLTASDHAPVELFLD